jgi:hypothetical protein
VERKLLKARATESIADERGEIGRLAVTSPDDDGCGGAEPREVTNGPGDVLGGDIPEHTTEEDEISRDSSRVGVGDRRISGEHLHSIETGRVRGSTREEHVCSSSSTRQAVTSACRGCPASAPIRSCPCPAHMLIAHSGPGGARSNAARTCSFTSTKRRPSPESGFS